MPSPPALRARSSEVSADAVTRIPLTGLLVCALLVVVTILLSRRQRLGDRYGGH